MSTAIPNNNALTIKGKLVDDSAIADGYVLTYDSASGTLKYSSIVEGEVAISDVTGLVDALALKAALSHVHSGANITSGTVADARLSANIPLKDATNIFSGASNTFNSPVIVNGPVGDHASQFKAGAADKWAVVVAPYDSFSSNPSIGFDANGKLWGEGAEFSDNITATNLSGSNTGDQDLSPYYLIESASTDFANVFTALADYAPLAGASFSGDISANNLSGTNTGDQDLSGYATNESLANYVAIGGDAFSLTNINIGALSGLPDDATVCLLGNATWGTPSLPNIVPVNDYLSFSVLASEPTEPSLYWYNDTFSVGVPGVGAWELWKGSISPDAAGSTASAPAAVGYYGADGDYVLGNPAAWLTVVIGGQTYVIPAYLVSA